jgi:signal peptidase I
MGGKQVKKGLRKVWWFIWESDSIWSWVVNILLAFIIIKFLVYPGLGLMLGTTHPVVAVVSSSMEHNALPICLRHDPNGNCLQYKEGKYNVCGIEIEKKGSLDFDEYFAVCGEWYLNNTEITKESFVEFRFRNGFNKGDIMGLGKPKDIKVGDTIVFMSAHKPEPIIHRIIKVNGDTYTTKGDRNSGSGDFEKRIQKDSIIGKAVLKVPWLGWIKIGFVGLLRLMGI